MNRCFAWIITIAAAAGVGWLFPLFHVVPLKTAAAEKAAATFNAPQFAEKFWTSRLPAALAQAVPAGVLLPAIQADAAAAKKKFARSVGLSDGYFYFVAGTGRVVAVTDDAVSLAVTAGAAQPEVALQTGLLFGNTIRDGTGLLNVNDYPDSQDFNDLSAALNHLVETRVLPELHAQAKVGAKISFVGCAEVDDEATDLHPLRVVPIQAEIQ